MRTRSIAYILLALAPVSWAQGPPAPREPAIALIEARLAEIKRVSDGTFLDAIIIGGGNGFDLWTTGKCGKDNPFCFEANPAISNSSGLQIIALKAAAYPIEVGICYLLRRWGHHTWARIMAFVSGGIHLAVGIHNLDIANDYEGPSITYEQRPLVAGRGVQFSVSF